MRNILMSLLGIGLFFSSFQVGESTVVGGLMHLVGCACFCYGVHMKTHKNGCNHG